MLSKVFITKLILYYAAFSGVDPQLALSVSKVESGLNPNAIGSIYHEVGLFQVRSEFSKYTKTQLKDPIINIQEGLRILRDAKKNCVHQKANQFLICFNAGKRGALKIKHPEKFDYVIKVDKMIASLK